MPVDQATPFDSRGASDSLAVSATVTNAIGAAHQTVCRVPRSRVTGCLRLAPVGLHAASASRPPPSANPETKTTVKPVSATSHKPRGVKFQLPKGVKIQLPLTLI